MKLTFESYKTKTNLFKATCDLISHSFQQNVEEEIVRLRGHVPLEVDDLVVAALHDVLLHADRVPDVDALQLLA